MSPSIEPILELRGVQKFFDGRQVLKDINLMVAPGETLVIIGGSGCGKSTLLRTIIGEHAPDAGHIYLWGEDVCCASPRRLDQLRQRFGKLGLASASRSKKQEGADRTVVSLDPRSRPSYRLGNRANRLILINHALHQEVLEV